jgi:hypothetical protein
MAAEERVELKLPIDEIAALDAFVSDTRPTMLRSEALQLIVRDWLIGHGYLEPEPPREDAN